MKRFIAIFLMAVILFTLPVQAVAKSKRMDADVPVWTEETVRQYILDYVNGTNMDVLYSYYDLQIRRYMPERAYQKMLTELEWLTGDFVCLGSYSSFEETDRQTKTHVVHMHMQNQDLDVYFTHKNQEDDWEIMSFEFVPAAKQEVDMGFAVDTPPPVAISFEESHVVLNEGTAYELKAIITMPAGVEAGDQVPACVLVHDAGALDMNATVGSTRFFEHLAHELADAGIASIRYDKRTYTYGETADMSVYDEVVADAVAAAELLSETEGIDDNAIVVIGHGFGGAVAPYIVSESNNLIDAMILIGSRPESYARQLLLTAELDTAEKNELEEVVRNLRKMTEDEARNIELFGRNGSYFWELDQHGHVSTIIKLETPTYIVQGRNDHLVTEDEGIRSWQEELKNYGMFVDYQTYRGLNHMLSNDLSVDEKGMPQYTVDAGIDVVAVRDLASWIMKLQEVDQ